MANQRYTCKQIIEAIKDSRGLKAAIARRLGCHVNTVSNYIKRHPSVARAYQDEREAIVDQGESVIIQGLRDNDLVTARWVCATLGKDRGWVEQVEQKQSGEIILRVVRSGTSGTTEGTAP